MKVSRNRRQTARWKLYPGEDRYLRNRYSAVCITSIDGLMPPNLLNMVAIIHDFSGCAVFAQHRSTAVCSHPATGCCER